MEALDSQNQYTKHDTGSVKRKPIPNTNGPQFTIPRLKKIKRDLLTDLPIDAHECQQEIVAVIRKSFHIPFSNACYTFNRVQSVRNPELTAKYLDRRRDMKSSGYPDALVVDTYAFLPVDSPSTADKMCRDGVRCGNQQFSGLGVSHMAVHVCKHADILTPMKPKYGDKMLLMVKLLKGKVKTVLCKNVGVQLEPTPNYDCHIAKPNVDQSAPQPPHMLFYSSQLYVYEYGDFMVEDYPRQVLPYAVVYYSIREPHISIPKNIVSLPHPAQVSSLPSLKGSLSSTTTLSSMPSSVPSSSASDAGPNNEVWRGRLHVHLKEGGHIFIEVVMLSYFVPLTVSLISPIKIHSLYPEHNAQFTFFCGLTNIAHKDEVEWRAHYFRSYTMRPRPNNEEHFKALIKHISVKREMPTIRLPNDVFLFLMPDCLVASQLGFVRRDDDSAVLHCVIMSKYSTSQAQEKHLMERKVILNNYGSATTWENLFDDSDFSDDEEQMELDKTRRPLRKSVSTMFREQRYIHNKFAAMSLADAEINFAPCACKKLSASKTHQQRSRDNDVARVYSAVQPQSQSNHSQSSHFPPGSRHRPKQRMSRKAKAMPSFSPHGSDSDSDSVRGYPVSDHFSLLNSTKTVEEELSEEELTNEQMEDIIFLRKPVVSVSSFSKPLSHPASSTSINKPSKPANVSAAVHSMKSSYSTNDLKRYNKSPLSSKPKIIPIEPLKPTIEKPIQKAPIISVKPKIIPTEPVESVSGLKVGTGNSSAGLDKPSGQTVPKIPKSILKCSIKSTANTESCPAESKHSSTVTSQTVSFPCENIDFGDVDMRVPHQHSTNVHPVFLSAVQSSLVQPTELPLPQQQQQPLSPNLSFGSWLAPGDIQPPIQPPLSSLQHSPFKLPVAPSSPPVTSSPLSPPDTPASPPSHSPVSPPSSPGGMDSESPASPPQSMFVEHFRSSPVAIPTSRVRQNASPEVSFVYQDPFIPLQTSSRGSVREGIDSADDMKNFLNSGFDSDLDSSYEDER